LSITPSTSLREPLLKVLREAPASLPVPDVFGRPVFLLAPGTPLARHFAKVLVRPDIRIVAGVDTAALEAPSAGTGIEVWSAETFVSKVGSYPRALAIDFSDNAEDLALFVQLCEQHDVERIDFAAALEAVQFICIYQLPSVMRSVTLGRIDEFLRLADTLEDPLSRETVYAQLLLRLTYDRRWLGPVLVSQKVEYFSTGASELTFRLCEDEVLCDAGAYIGTTVARFVGATRGRYRAIHAFEPDRRNFRRLENLRKLGLRDLHLHNLALADRNEVINFMEVEAMGSHLTRGGNGNSSIQAVRLDDQIEEVSFLKMDIEGGEELAMKGAQRLLTQSAPRLAVTVYHYAHDLLDVPATILRINPRYRFRLRQHACYYFDMVLYGEAR
jgi:FkbM family methyltransferase